MLTSVGEASKWVPLLCYGKGKEVSAIFCHDSTKNFLFLSCENRHYVCPYKILKMSDIRNMPDKDIHNGIPLNNNNSASVHRPKCLFGRCGVQHPMPRDLERVLPTSAPGNRHTGLSPSCGPYSGLWTVSSPFWPQSSSPWRTIASENHSWMRDPLWKSKFPTVKPQHIIGGKKQKTVWTYQKELRGIVRLYPHHPFPKAAQLSASLTCDFSCRNKWEDNFPSCVEPCQRGPFLSHHIQSTELWVAWPGKQKRLEEQQREISEGIKRRWILLCCGIHQEAPHMNHWGYLWITPNWAWALPMPYAPHCINPMLCPALCACSQRW